MRRLLLDAPVLRQFHAIRYGGFRYRRISFHFEFTQHASPRYCAFIEMHAAHHSTPLNFSAIIVPVVLIHSTALRAFHHTPPIIEAPAAQVAMPLCFDIIL